MDPTPVAPFTVKETARILKIDEATVRRQIRTGTINANRVGRSYRIPAAEMARLTGEQVVA